jgi:hypothetical protein
MRTVNILCPMYCSERQAGKVHLSVHLKVLWNIIHIIQFLVHTMEGNMSENKKTKSHNALAYLFLGCNAL